MFIAARGSTIVSVGSLIPRKQSLDRVNNPVKVPYMASSPQNGVAGVFVHTGCVHKLEGSQFGVNILFDTNTSEFRFSVLVPGNI